MPKRRYHRYFIPKLPVNINKYIGRTNIWEYHKEKNAYSKLVGKIVPALEIERCRLVVTYHFPDRRKRDPNNLDKCLLDALVNNRVIVDDNYMCIISLAERGMYDRGNEGVELIVIEV